MPPPRKRILFQIMH